MVPMVLGATCTNPNANELVEFPLPGLVDDAMPFSATGCSKMPPVVDPGNPLEGILQEC